MMPVPVERTVPVRISFERASQPTSSSKRRFSWPVVASPAKTSRSPRRTRQRSSIA